MTTEQAKNWIVNESNGKIFAVEFLKRSTQELRLMNCRTRVSKNVQGIGRSYNPEEHALIPVYDMGEDNGHKCIPADGIRRIKIDGKWHQVTKG